MNQGFKNVLAIQDAYRDSVEAMGWANRIVSPNGRIKILDVQPPLSALWQELFNDEFEATPANHRQRSLNELAKGVDFSIDSVTAQVRSGTPVVQIVREALDGNFDLVVKEAYSKAGDFFFGSLDMRLMRYCPTPVWLARPESGHTCKRVLVAINPEAGKREMILNDRLLNYASSVAQGFDCKLFVVGAYLSNHVSFPVLDRDSLMRIERQSTAAYKAALDQLDEIVAKSIFPVDPEDVILAEGSPDDVILNAVERVKPELLVMGSVARHGISGLMVGNAAERVLRQVKCSVLTVKPKNFVCPIASDEPTRGDNSTGMFAY